MKNFAAALPFLALSSLVAACSGGGGGGGGNQGAPCCFAGGETEAPSSFAPSATRFAQPIVFTTTSECISLSNPDVLLLPAFETVGDAVPVDTVTGRYTVAIEESGAGQEVGILIFDDTGDLVTERGMAPIPAPPSADESYEISPIRFPLGKIGESTLEAGVFCAMRNNTLAGGLQGNLTFADVRAAISSELAAAYADGVTPAVLGVHVARYRHGVNGIANLIPGPTQRAIFGDLRRAAEQEADRVRSTDGTSQAEARAALARYRTIVNATTELAAVEFPHEPFKHLHAWSQDVIEEMELGTGPDSDLRFEGYRSVQLLRFAIAEERIRAAALQSAGLDLTPDNPDLSGETINTLLARLENDLLIAVTLAGLRNAWDRFGLDLIQNISENNPALSADLPTITSDVDPVSNQFRAEDLSDSTAWPHTNLLLRLYQGDGGTISGAWADMRSQMNQGALANLSAAEQDQLNDFYFYSRINGIP